jgi:hypothetical protein
MPIKAPHLTSPGVEVVHGAVVVRFYYRGDDSRLMRVVVSADNHVAVEEYMGLDALGGTRWQAVDLDGDEDTAAAWVGMVAAAMAWAYRELVDSPVDDKWIHKLATLGEALGLPDFGVQHPSNIVGEATRRLRRTQESSLKRKSLLEMAAEWHEVGSGSCETIYERGEAAAWRLASRALYDELGEKPPQPKETHRPSELDDDDWPSLGQQRLADAIRGPTEGASGDDDVPECEACGLFLTPGQVIDGWTVHPSCMDVVAAVYAGPNAVRRECVALLESAGYDEAAEMLQGIADDIEEHGDERPPTGGAPSETLARFEVVGEPDDKALRGWTEGDKQGSTHDELTIFADVWDVGTVVTVTRPQAGGAEPEGPRSTEGSPVEDWPTLEELRRLRDTAVKKMDDVGLGPSRRNYHHGEYDTLSTFIERLEARSDSPAEGHECQDADIAPYGDGDPATGRVDLSSSSR